MTFDTTIRLLMQKALMIQSPFQGEGEEKRRGWRLSKPLCSGWGINSQLNNGKMRGRQGGKR